VHSIATTKDLDMTQFDIKTRFLHGELIKGILPTTQFLEEGRRKQVL
jgi:hypothetical protein